MKRSYNKKSLSRSPSPHSHSHSHLHRPNKRSHSQSQHPQSQHPQNRNTKDNVTTSANSNIHNSKNTKESEATLGKDWNPNNVLLDRTFVESIIEKFCGASVRIYDLRKYQLAFVHKSVKKRDISPHTDEVLDEIAKAKAYGKPIEPILNKYGTWNNGEPVVFTQDYEQIEFVGDGWIGSIVGDYLYSLFPRQGEGFYTKLKQNIVCKSGLAALSTHLGFDKYLLLSTRNEQRYGRDNQSYLEDVFEAFCGAIKQDLGIPMLILFLKNAIESAMDFEYFITTDTNFKDTLMRFFQSNGWPQPKYPDIKEIGTMHNKIYFSGVEWLDVFDEIGIQPVYENGTKYLAIASNKAKKEAQKEAAKISLERFRKLAKTDPNIVDVK